jgi:hypothetical protein
MTVRWGLVLAHVTTGLIGLTIGACTAFSNYPAPEPVVTVISVPPDEQDIRNLFKMPIPATPSRHQHELLDIAYHVARQEGLDYPGLLQGIIMQESQAGADPAYKVAGPPGRDRYYGVGQIKVDAARDVLRRYPDLWTRFRFQTHTDEEVVARLIEDDVFNITVACKYLLILRASGYRTPGQLAVAYNKGPGAASGVLVSADPYAKSVSAHIQRVSRPATVIQGSVYHVRTGDSLSSIAARAGVPTLVLFRLNRHAFIDDNPDVLMAGADLKLPSKGT